MDIRKSLQASTFSFISPKLVGKAVLQFVNYVALYKQRSMITSYFKEKPWKHNNFQFQYCKFSQEKYFELSYY